MLTVIAKTYELTSSDISNNDIYYEFKKNFKYVKHRIRYYTLDYKILYLNMQNFEPDSKKELVNIYCKDNIINFKNLNVKYKKKSAVLYQISFKDIKFYYKKFNYIFRYLLLLKTNMILKKSLILNFMVLNRYVFKNLSINFLNWYRISNKKLFFLKKLFFVIYFNCGCILKKTTEYKYIKNDLAINSIVENYDLLENKFFFGFTYFNGINNKKLANSKYILNYLSVYNLFSSIKWKTKVVKANKMLNYFQTKFYINFKKLNKIIYKKFNNIFISISTDNIKFLKINNLKNIFIFYIRKNKLFIKGRYSRNRQYYKTGVYWCLWVNIIAVFGLYFLFYKFLINYSYIWWLFFLFISIFIVPKYFFYNQYFLIVSDFIKNFFWLFDIIVSYFYIKLIEFIKKFKYQYLFYRLLKLKLIILYLSYKIYLKNKFYNFSN